MRIIGRIFAILACALLLNSCEGSIIRSAFKPTPTKAPAQNNQSKKAPVQNLPAQNISAQKSQIDPKVIRKKVKVAALLPLSGKSKELGTAMLNSIILSLFENDKNNDVELVVFDSSDIKKAVEEIAGQNIKTIIGPIFSSDIEAISSVAQTNKISILSFSNNQDLAGKKGVFLMGFLPEQQVERISSYAISNGKDNFAIIAPNNQYGQKFSTILKDMVKRKDGNFVSSELYANSSKDLEKAVSKVLSSYIKSPNSKNKKNAKDGEKFYANTIVIPESGAVLTKIVSLINKYNTSEREIQIIGSSNWDDITTLNDPNLIGSWFVSANPDKYRDFEKRYYQLYNKFPPRISGIAYDATLAVAETIRKSGKRELSAEDFINYQSAKNGFVGIDGLFRFLPNGIVQRNFAMLEIKNGKFEMIDSPSSMFFKY
ncbi:MAG: penicillin-binding protein activator [Pseudomonadota bacterium]